MTIQADDTRVYVHKDRGLKATDRCDRCDAQAYLSVVYGAGLVLMLCSHHATEHYDSIVLSHPLVIDDYRPFLGKEEAQAR